MRATSVSSSIGEAWQVTELSAVERGEYAVSVAPPPTGWTAYFVELVYPSPRPGLCQVYSTRVFVTPEIRPFEGMQPPAAGDDLVPADGGGIAAAASAAGLASRLRCSTGSSMTSPRRCTRACSTRPSATSASGRSDTASRATSTTSTRRSELYVRLGFGQSVEGFLEERLEDLWRDVRGTAEDVVDGAGDAVDDAGDAVDDLF